MWVTNQPKRFSSSESRKSVFGGRDDFRNALNVMSVNIDRKARREKSSKIVISGCVVLFVGIGLFVSAKKED